MSTYSQIKNGLDEISSKNAKNRLFIESARSSLDKALTSLNAMPAEYSDLVLDINNGAIENPDDQAYIFAKAEKDKLVSDFQNLKTYVNNLITAFDAVEE
jgi:hypothetical protein